MDDWRITNQMHYLYRERLRLRSYAPSNQLNDHDHCEFCFSKFMLENENRMLEEGYATVDGYRWICKTCYADFKTRFDWQLA